MPITTKICGLSTPDAIAAAQDNGADFLGFIFYPPSPRHLTPAAASRLAPLATVKKVAVTVNPDDALLQQIIESLAPDYLQLHGSESAERAREITTKFNLPLIRSLHPNQPPEPNSRELYEYLLVDAPKGKLPGGNGIVFDWHSFTPPKHPWFLSGGLNIDNIEEAVKLTGAQMIDVSSGVESSPGVKDVNKIANFLKKVHELQC